VSDHATDFQGDVAAAIRTAVTQAIPDAVVVVTGGGGHWSLQVTSTAFDGKSQLQSHKLVLGAIKHLMAGAAPPVHAVDSLVTKLP
jgi:acid stress-induced BolA-like protein IbaG/YrbA